MDTIYLVAGLGNPGAEYARTRHNAGFMAVECFGSKFGANWKNEAKFQSRVARIEARGRKVILCEPQTFMNASGEAIAPLAAYYKVPQERILVVVDDADLPFGQIRLRAEGSSGGHHGLDSIEHHLSTRQFARLRVGIGRTDRGLREITGHVLGKFSADEAELLEKVLERTAGQIECYLTDGVQKAMSQFNGAVLPSLRKEDK
ncbi:MAG TPA: aminoacyl-tRNA hydrolase [Candidatus Kapabacteria bacterium]|jgi:peptidyl-tRNA hydrolase, PTH1 family|nr:aminoacyl-tRNA hydrolase [Candidatus Kapabacteria bacterium]